MNNLIYIINGPNLNKLGVRQTEKYGSKSIIDLKKLCEKTCKKHNITMDFFQSNKEYDIIDKIHEAKDKASAILINAAAKVGKLIAERAIDAGVKQVAFDRSGYRYHGRVKALAEAARSAGLVF